MYAQKTEDVNLKVFHMIKGINEPKQSQNIFHVNADVNLMVENEIKNKNGIMIRVNVSVKKQ